MGKRKTPAKSPVALVPQKHGGALRIGGTNKGGPGRPPDEFKAALAKLADDAVRAGHVATILTNPDHPQFLRALEWATDRGYGKVETKVDATVRLAGVVVLPSLVPE